MIASASTASADVIYQFYGTMTGGPYIDKPLDLQLTVTDAAVASGSMNFFVSNPGPVACGPTPYLFPCNVTGDDSGFVSFRFAGHSSQLNPSGGTQGYSFLYNLTFNPDGTLGGNFSELGFESGVNLSGSGLDWTGNVGADFLLCPQNGCAATGYFSSVGQIPEPSTWALMLAGMAGLAGIRALRRQRTTQPKDDF